jgi:hypothetical protein
VVVTQCGGQQKLGFLMKDINGDTSLIYGWYSVINDDWSLN